MMENKTLGKISIVLLTLNFLFGSIVVLLEGGIILYNDSAFSVGWILLISNIILSIFVLIYISIKMLKMENDANYKLFTNKRLGGFFIFLIILSVVCIIGASFIGSCFVTYGVGHGGKLVHSYCSLVPGGSGYIQLFFEFLLFFDVIFSVLLGYWISIKLVIQKKLSNPPKIL